MKGEYKMKINVNLWADTGNSYPTAQLEIARHGKNISLKLSDSEREIVVDRDDFLQAVLCVHGSCERQ